MSVDERLNEYEYEKDGQIESERVSDGNKNNNRVRKIISVLWQSDNNKTTTTPALRQE